MIKSQITLAKRKNVSMVWANLVQNTFNIINKTLKNLNMMFNKKTYCRKINKRNGLM